MTTTVCIEAEFNLELEVEYRVWGKHVPATRETPEELPSVEVQHVFLRNGLGLVCIDSVVTPSMERTILDLVYEKLETP